MWISIDVFFNHRSQRSHHANGATEKPAEKSAGFCIHKLNLKRALDHLCCKANHERIAMFGNPLISITP